MVISRSGPASSRRYDYMATAAKPPPPHASSSPSTHPSSTASTTSTMKRQSQQQQQHQHQHQRGIVQNHHHHHQSSLHDFSFPVLAWGRQRLLRCAKVPPNRNEGASFGGGCAGSNVSRAGGVVTDRRFAAPPPVLPRTKVAKVKDDGLEKIRAKLMGQLREAAGRMELEGRAFPASAARRSDAPPTWDEEDEEEEDEEEDDGDDEEDDEEYPDALDRTPVPAPSLAAAVAPLPQPLVPAGPLEEVKPWKMRTRRSTYKHARTSEPRRRRLDSSPSPAVSSPHRAPPSAAAGGAAANPADPLPVPVAPPPPRSLRSRSSAPPSPEDQDPAADEDQHQRAQQPRRSRQQPSRQPQQQQRRKPFSVTLSKEEIEEDIYALTGRRASRRPKKRPRALRRQLDMLVPGYYLSEVTLSQYDVREPARES